MKITAISMRGVPVERPLSAEFGAAGGTIGRTDTNTLVLDDPERTVSRVHAMVLFRQGQFFIVDQGSNPLQMNGSPLGLSKEAALAEGDRLQLGSFELVVSEAGARNAGDAEVPGALVSPVLPGADDPFADLMAGLTPAPAPVVHQPSMPDSSLFPDPLGLAPVQAVHSPGAHSADPFADLFASSPGDPASTMDGLAGVAAPSPGIDELFGLGSLGIGADPLAMSPLAAPLAQPNTAPSVDPLRALQESARPGLPAQADQVPVLQQAFKPPQARMEAAQSVPTERPAAAAHAAPLHKQGPVGLGLEVASMDLAAPAAGRSADTPPAAGARHEELLAAFLRGVGSNYQMPEVLTPELMERMGSLLRTSADGVLQLLLTRQEFKRGLRSEVTMISTEANNPLKFSPTVEVALAHLLGSGTRGFMPADEAMSNAFADLRAHQFGMMVGLRAAFAHVLEVFTPEKLEQRISEKSRLDSLFTANRKAKLWDQFCQLYVGIAAEAEDDFHSLFGKAFTKAYEEQMERFRTGG